MRKGGGGGFKDLLVNLGIPSWRSGASNGTRPTQLSMTNYVSYMIELSRIPRYHCSNNISINVVLRPRFPIVMIVECAPLTVNH